MTVGLVVITILALIIIFCTRHFFVQLIAIKLLIDALVLIAASLRSSTQVPYNGESMSVLIGSLGLLVFFVLLATGIHQSSKAGQDE